MSFDPAAGTYTYTPTQAARDAAAQNPGLTDTFTIRATDTKNASVITGPVTITIDTVGIVAQCCAGGDDTIDRWSQHQHRRGHR